MKAQENSSMQKDIVFLDLFSGIGGFSKGFEEAGFRIKKHYFSEVDKYAIANYQFNFKHAIHVGSITDVRGSELERPNVITFGSPCQDFSMAGKRSGMATKIIGRNLGYEMAWFCQYPKRNDTNY
jgi:DNA (cytosine-5)-methyltransferase 1